MFFFSSTHDFVSRNSKIEIVKKLLDQKNDKEAIRFLNSNETTTYTYYALHKTLHWLFFNTLPKSDFRYLYKTNLFNKDSQFDLSKGSIFLTFHLIGNFDVIVGWLSQRTDKLHIVHGEDFFRHYSKKYFGIDNANDIEKVKVKTNKNFKINLISHNKPNVFYEIVKVLKNNEKVLMVFDEFPKSRNKPNNHFINYYINNNIAARVPKTLFYILNKSNCQLITLMNIKHKIVYNYLNILENNLYNLTVDSVSFESECERILKDTYDFYLDRIRENPLQVIPSVWLRFYYLIKHTSKLLVNKQPNSLSNDTRFTANGTFKFFIRKKQNYGYIFRVNDLKCIKANFYAISEAKRLLNKKTIHLNDCISEPKSEGLLHFLYNENLIKPINNGK